MSDKEVVETLYGKYSKYEIIKHPGVLFGGPTFSINKDGKVYKVGYSSLSAAVDAARADGAK